MKYTSFEDFLIKEAGMTLDEFLRYAKESVEKGRSKGYGTFTQAEKYWRYLSGIKAVDSFQIEEEELVNFTCNWMYMKKVQDISWDSLHNKWVEYIYSLSPKIVKIREDKYHIEKPNLEFNEALI